MISWAQYDRGFRHQVAHTKDLRSGQKKSMACANCLSSSHETAFCLDNAVLFSLQGLPTRKVVPAPAQSALSKGLAKLRTSGQVCYLFNTKKGAEVCLPCMQVCTPLCTFFCKQHERNARGQNKQYAKLACVALVLLGPFRREEVTGVQFGVNP